MTMAGAGTRASTSTRNWSRRARLALTERSKIALPVRWGRYRLEVSDPQTQLTIRYGFYAGWGAQDADDIGNRPDRVQLKLQGAPFKPGDVAKLATSSRRTTARPSSRWKATACCGPSASA
jgi:uncharacterized protein YfaS (alpha-2-macroglobulin family)